MPDFTIIGAQKAATSSLQAALRQHPQIWMPKGESPWFEDPEFGAKHWTSLPTVPSDTRVGIKRPTALADRMQRHRIAHLFPKMRFIVVLRDPISRARSACFHLMRHGQMPLAPLGTGLHQCLAEFAAGTPSLAAGVVDQGRYGHHLAKWFSLFDPDQFLILSQAQVLSETQTALDACCRHLGIRSFEAAPSAPRENSGTYGSYALSLARAAQVLKTRFDGERSYARSPRWLWRSLATGPQLAAGCLAIRRGDPPEISGEILEELTTIYAADTGLLRNLAPPGTLYWRTGGASGKEKAVA